jgi:hypothetical protein
MKVIRVKKVQEGSGVKMLCSQVGECRCLQADSRSLLQSLKFVGEVALAKVPANPKQEKKNYEGFSKKHKEKNVDFQHISQTGL